MGMNWLWPVLSLLAGPVLASSDGLRLIIEEGHFALETADGYRLPEGELLNFEWHAGRGIHLRIEGIETDPFASGHLTLYDISYRQGDHGAWEALCEPGPFGLSLAVPMAGVYREDGRFIRSKNGGFGFSCTTGAHVKCLRLGYTPWKLGADGRSLASYHQACTRMMRADYCGDGQAHTVAGRQLLITDGLSPPPRQEFGGFEAVWGEDGAICVKRARVEEQFPLKNILQSCPRLQEMTGPRCHENLLEKDPKALLINRS